MHTLTADAKTCVSYRCEVRLRLQLSVFFDAAICVTATEGKMQGLKSQPVHDQTTCLWYGLSTELMEGAVSLMRICMSASGNAFQLGNIWVCETMASTQIPDPDS